MGIFLVFFTIYASSVVFKKKHTELNNPALTTALDRQIEKLESQINSKTANTQTYITLSSLYIQKIRETADTDYYNKIDALMNQASEREPGNSDILATKALVAIGRHNFIDGKMQIEKAIAIDGTHFTYYGTLGDSSIELGQYDDAVTAFQKMVDLRPDFSSYSRIAYIRELYGDIPGAKESLRTAIVSGSSFKENIAWAHTELGKLELHSDAAKAKLEFDTALSIVPEYPPALEGLAKIEVGKKNYTGAIKILEKAYAVLPIAQYAIDLGDVYLLAGDSVKSNQYFTLAKITFEKTQSSGTITDLEQSFFLSDHELDLAVALNKAESAYKARPLNIYAADYYAWALYKNGKISEALALKQKALALGEHDALILYHQGVIEREFGNTREGERLITKAYSINPYFSFREIK